MCHTSARISVVNSKIRGRLWVALTSIRLGWSAKRSQNCWHLLVWQVHGPLCTGFTELDSSYTHSFIHWFIHSFVHSVIHSLMHSYIQFHFICISVQFSSFVFVISFQFSSVHFSSLFHSNIHSFMHSLNHYFIPSFLRPSFLLSSIIPLFIHSCMRHAFICS